jgi:hypothetical protein
MTGTRPTSRAANAKDTARQRNTAAAAAYNPSVPAQGSRRGRCAEAQWPDLLHRATPDERRPVLRQQQRLGRATQASSVLHARIIAQGAAAHQHVCLGLANERNLQRHHVTQHVAQALAHLREQRAVGRKAAAGVSAHADRGKRQQQRSAGTRTRPGQQTPRHQLPLNADS